MIAHRSFFITGFPGFIATRLVQKLAGQGGEFHLLVEPRFAANAQAIARKLSSHYPDAKFSVVTGDITKPGLAIETQSADKIRAEVRSVYHLAAIYDLDVKREPAMLVNVTGTKNVNDFVATLENPERYNYISTCYVAGLRRGRILESELEHNAGFRNFYEESKYLAELSVEQLKPDLPITIFRPSVVVGDSVSGETAKYDGIYYLIRYLARSPQFLRLVNVGNNRVRLNLVPVDFVVDSMAALDGDSSVISKTLALADPHPLTTAELFDVIAENLSGKRALLMPPPSLVKFALSLPLSPMITGLPHSGVPYFFIEQEYDTSIANALLSKYGIKCPPFNSYAGAIIDFVRRNPKL